MNGAEWSKERVHEICGGRRAAKRLCTEARVHRGAEMSLERLFYDLQGLSRSELQRTQAFIDELLRAQSMPALPATSVDDVLVVPPLRLVSGKFHPHLDLYYDRPSATSVNFVPRSDMVYAPGALSRQAGGAQWFSTGSFHERLSTMVEVFRRRSVWSQRIPRRQQ